LILRSAPGNRASKRCINSLDQLINTRRELLDAVLKSLEKSLAIRPVLDPLEESVFIRQGDYWTIRYQGQTAILKATRGLDCLACLLRRPGRQVHVRELLPTAIHLPAPALLGSSRTAGSDAVTAGLQYALPIFDSQAKSEYNRRIDGLRKDAEEAERFSDSYRAARSRN
jgi:hypothetical protein